MCLKFEILSEYVLDQNIDSVEFSPFAPRLAVGEYQLDETVYKRKGGLTLYNYENGILKTHLNTHKDGILDIKWLSIDLIICALATGGISLVKLNETGFDNEVYEVSPNNLILSITFNKDNIIVSTSDGSIVICDKRKMLPFTLKAHSYEAWIVAADLWDEYKIYSGGDDTKYKIWDLRDLTCPVYTSTYHQMGVCSIQSSPSDCNYYTTGGFEGVLALWDIRNQTQPLHTIELSSGIWRTKWKTCYEPIRPAMEILLIACTHGGTYCLDLNQEKGFKILANYKRHTSLTYGADWIWDNSQMTPDLIIASSSFYSKELHLLKLSLNVDTLT